MKNSQIINWKERSIEERLEEVERLRREFWKGKYDENTRIEKIIRVFKKGRLVKVIDARGKKIKVIEK